jgi:hypothetical protein
VNRSARAIVSFWMSGMLAGCSPVQPGADGGDAGPGPQVELGSGQLEWEPHPSADPTTELVYGAQGGFHVWGRARFRASAPDVDISFRAVRESDGAELHRPTPVRRWIEGGVRYGLLPLPDGRLQTDAELVILSLDCARNLVGQRLSVEVTVRDRASGAQTTVQRSLRVIDEIPSPTSCVSVGDGGGLRDGAADSGR